MHKIVDMYQCKCRNCGKVSLAGCCFPNIEKGLLENPMTENSEPVVDRLLVPWFCCPRCESQDIYNIYVTVERVIAYLYVLPSL